MDGFEGLSNVKLCAHRGELDLLRMCGCSVCFSVCVEARPTRLVRAEVNKWMIRYLRFAGFGKLFGLDANWLYTMKKIRWTLGGRGCLFLCWGVGENQCVGKKFWCVYSIKIMGCLRLEMITNRLFHLTRHLKKYENDEKYESMSTLFLPNYTYN